MYKLKFQITLTKPLVGGMDKKVVEILAVLQEKFTKQNKKFEFKHKTGKDSLEFEINSEDYAATDLLVQFDKQVRETLGKEFKCGIKSWEIPTYEITQDLEEAPKKSFTIPLAKELKFKGKQAVLTYENFPFEWVKEHYVEKSLKLIKERIKQFNYEGKDEFKEYVWEGKERKVTYTGDPAVDLEKKEWIRRTEAKGQFIYGREFTALVNVLKELYVEKIYGKLGFYEMIFPKFEPWEIPKKSGHARNIYPNAYFVSVPKNASLEYWQEIMDLYEITGEVQVEKIPEKTVNVGIMSYAQCPPFWPFLKNKVIDPETLPLLTYDWSGPTYRNESGGTHGLDRVEEFHRIETLFVGTKEQEVKAWKELKEAFIKFYDEVLEMEIKVARVTPWWMAHAGARTEQGNEEVGTFDFDAYLPYRGDRSKEWLEVQNVSSNGEKYPTAFNVKSRTQEFLWSGCAGASFERVIVAFLAQKGLETKNWPKEVRERFEKKVKGIKELKFY
ncbi:MAG: aminoacyl--tRNA ligase-related protein [Nanoarchaeota archaeon]